MHLIKKTMGIFAMILGSLVLLAIPTYASFATQLTAEPGQTPMPNGVGAVPENCKGIAPTSGSSRQTTQKELNDGQGLVSVGANSFLPGGSVHWLIRYHATNTAKSFDIRDCVVEFLPNNPNAVIVGALVEGHGQIVATPGSTPAIKGYDSVLDNAEFDFADDVALPGEFDLSWTVPANAPPGALICNYAKDTGGTDVGGNENRKAGACFEVEGPVTTSTSSTTVAAPTTTSSSPTTSSTAPSQTTTGLPNATAVTTTTTLQGPLAATGKNIQAAWIVAGALILMGGLLVLTQRHNQVK